MFTGVYRSGRARARCRYGVCWCVKGRATRRHCTHVHAGCGPAHAGHVWSRATARHAVYAGGGAGQSSHTPAGCKPLLACACLHH